MLDLAPDLIQEITAIVFDYPSPPLQPCDIIFVFGGSHPGLWETAAQAYHAGLGKVIIATGGHKPGVKYHRTWMDGVTPEAHVIKRELMRLGVPGGCVVCEDRSTNSLENVLFAKEIYDFSTVNSILVVCKNYGVGRQCRTLRQHRERSVALVPYSFDAEAGSDGPYITRGTWMNYPEGRALVLSQLVKMYRYGKLGHLEPVGAMSPDLEELVRRQAAS